MTPVSPVNCGSHLPAGFFIREPRAARKHLGRIAATKTANKVRFNRRAGEQCGVDLRIVEPRHWAAVQTDRASRRDQISALQAPVAKSRCFSEPGLRFAFEPGLCSGI